MAKQYEAIFRIWDASSGEKTATLLEESEVYTFSPLSGIVEHWDAFCENCPVELDEIKERALRVSMTRNDGVGVQRRRFVFEGTPYLVTIHAAEVSPIYHYRLPDGGDLQLQIKDGEPKLFLGGEGFLTADKNTASQLTLSQE